jgi:hypothetical protein
MHVKDGGLEALADIDHMYSKCSEGLRENISFLMEILYGFRSRRV